MRIVLLLALCAFSTPAQSLRQQLRSIAAEAHGNVSVACSLPGSTLNCDVDPASHPPMQSLFKLPLALTALHLVEQGKLSLDQQVRFLPSDRILPKTFSPLQDKYPDANVEIQLRSLAQAAVSVSDNTAADILVRLVGGPKVVNDYIASLGIRGFHLLDDEHAMHREVTVQYRNWFEPRAAVQLLRRIAGSSPLTAEHTALLLEWMRPAVRGKRLQGELPDGTIFAHKTGTSGVDNGLAHATNDIGLISLPDGRQLAIAVFVTDSTAGEVTRESVIARIGRAAYDAAIRERVRGANR